VAYTGVVLLLPPRAGPHDGPGADGLTGRVAGAAMIKLNDLRGATVAVAALALLLAGSAAPAAGAARSSAVARVTEDGVLGEVVRTGCDDWLIYAVPVVLPSAAFGVALGLPGPRPGHGTGPRPGQGAAGPQVVVLANESRGADRSPGFHAVQGAAEIGTRRTLTFGYYVGPAVRILGRDRARDKTVAAGQAAWSVDPSVVFFWFPAGAGALSRLRALDAAGRRLPAGDPRITVG
jgi:hypothetical protein